MDPLAYSAVLDAIWAIMPDQVPITQRRFVGRLLGIRIGTTTGTFVVTNLPKPY